MNRWKTMIALLLAVVYLPAVSRCSIERSGLLPNEDCCTPTSQGAPTGDSSSNLQCCALASPKYKLSEDRLAELVATLADFLTGEVVVDPVRPPEPPRLGTLSAFPPEFPVCWQFCFRTALPPRAPSFVS